MQLHVPLRLRRLAGTDPGRARLTNSIAVSVAVLLAALASWLIVRYDISDRGFLVVGILGTVQVSTSIKGPTAHDRLVTTALSLIPLIAAPTVAILLDHWRYVEIAVFIVLAGGATWARRFGPRAGELGTIAFLAYFFALFLRPPLAELPGFLLIFACVWGASVLVRLALTHERPAHQLSLLLAELRATGRATVALAVAVAPESERSPALDTQIRRLDDVAQAVNRWQHHFPTAQTIDCTAEDLITRTLDARIDVEHAALEVAALVRDDHPDNVRAALADPLADLDILLSPHSTAADIEAATVRAQRLIDTGDDDTPLGLTAILLARATLANRALREVDLTRPLRTAPPAVTPAPPAHPAPVAADRPAVHWWWWRTWPMTERLALQAMVAAGTAAVVGELINASRWYWAVMAAFLIFVGSTTRGAVLTRASHRVVGTLGGIVVGLVVGFLIDGPSPWHVALAVVSVFGTLYFGPLKQFAGAFFSTLLVVAMYGLLGVLNPQLLTIRLEETAAGAAVGVACAYLLFSASSRPALNSAITGYLEALRTLVKRIGVAFTTTGPAPDLLTATTRLDAAQADLVTATSSMAMTFANGRWSRTTELKYLLNITTHSAERAAKAALSVTGPQATGELAGPAAGAFDTAVAQVDADAEQARAALVDRARPGIDPDSTVIIDQIEKIGLPPKSAAAQVMLMLSRVDGALLRAAALRDRS
ncbi:FUSC family protein [Gordonia caeni]|uniref:Integral membrane bound transporter domain-containing protein n=1 Tax=Gordonia caeni TaxID=1007097 RepID=A0ABP7NNC2_9ACTN